MQLILVSLTVQRVSTPKSHILQKSIVAIFISSVQSLSCVQLFVIPLTAACQASLSITNSQTLLRLMSIEMVIHPTTSSSVILFSSCLQTCPTSVAGFYIYRSYPASGSFTVTFLGRMKVNDWRNVLIKKKLYWKISRKGEMKTSDVHTIILFCT